MLVNIGDIIIREDRIRKDFGDITELAEDIKVNGLINPPVVTPDKVLIAGERRIRAMRQLGYTQIEVRSYIARDYEHQLLLEISENENRKNFTFSERMKFVRRLETIEQEKAKERQSANLTNSLVSQNSDERENSAKSEEGRADEAIAEKVGLGSRDTLRKAKKIAEEADPELIKALDENQLSINGAYKKLQDSLKEKEDLLSSKNTMIESLMSKKGGKAAEEAAKTLEKKNDEILGLRRDLKKAEIELKDLQEVKAQKEELKTIKNNIEKLKERESKAIQEYKEMGKIFSWIDRAKKYIGDEMLQIPTLMYLPESPSKVVKDEVKHIIAVISDWSYAMRQKFQIEEDEL